MKISALLTALKKNDGSDLHVSSGSAPMLRVHGKLHAVKCPPLSSENVEAMINDITNDFQREELKKNMSLDLAYNLKGVGVFRVNVFLQRHGYSIVCRQLPETPPTLEDLNLPGIFYSASNYPNGLILVTGPTGSGKSTTLAAMINHINKNIQGHILTLEDPVEFRHETQKCMVNQRSLGDHFTNFTSALKGALREDPDVILVGEMRDLETIKLALEAAETGHLVFGTLHTNSAAKTVDRIINVFPAEEQNQIRTSLSESLRMVCSQKLIPSKDGKRMCFQDILVNTSAIGNLIRENKTFQIKSAMQTGASTGMQLMDNQLLKAVKKGKVDGVIAWESANDKALFKAYAPKEEKKGTDLEDQGQSQEVSSAEEDLQSLAKELETKPSQPDPGSKKTGGLEKPAEPPPPRIPKLKNTG
jgi:twitching motility protein PilT